MKWRKRPVMIEAYQWTGENLRDVQEWACETLSPLSNNILVHNDALKILTLEGWLSVSIGDWIICGVKGEFYPCKPDIFDATYEPAQEPVKR
jgi:hypothetical protein